MRYVILAGMLLVAGCDQFKPEVAKPASVVKVFTLPCMTAIFKNENDRYVKAPGELGFMHQREENGARQETTHCIPCAKATSSDEKFVCAGDAALQEDN
jgi:hypothetical protein